MRYKTKTTFVEAVRLNEPVYSKRGRKLASAGDWLVVENDKQYYMANDKFRSRFIPSYEYEYWCIPRHRYEYWRYDDTSGGVPIPSIWNNDKLNQYKDFGEWTELTQENYTICQMNSTI
jgi:hypothetical protein